MARDSAVGKDGSGWAPARTAGLSPRDNFYGIMLKVGGSNGLPVALRLHLDANSREDQWLGWESVR